MALFPGFDNLARTLITNYGEELTLLREDSSAYDPATSQVTTVSVSTTGNGYLSNYNFAEIDGNFIRSTDSKLLVHRLEFDPEVDDVVTIDNDDYRIMSVKKVRIEGQTPLFICQVRK